MDMSLWWLATLPAALVGAMVGHGIRRLVPAILSMKDRTLPFERPWLEVTSAVLFVVIFVRLGWAISHAVWFVFAGLLLAITATDYLFKLIPDRLTFSGTLAGIAFHTLYPPPVLAIAELHALLAQLMGLAPGAHLSGLMLSVSGALLGLGALELIRWTFSTAVGMQVMGMGDSKLLMMIGAFLGPIGVMGALMLGFLFGVIHGLIYLNLSGQPHSPFGPPLAAAGLAVVLGADSLVLALGVLREWVLALPLELLAVFYTVLILIVFVLLARTRRRAAEYEELIEEDYRQAEEKLE